MKYKSLLLILLLLTANAVSAQGSVLEEYFYASGKIKVVVAVSSIVMLGLLIYVVSLDRRLNKIEKKNKAQ